jgi:hypothetical protein
MQDTTNSVWCFARLFHYPGSELLQAISLYCLRHWHRFKPQELANMIWSLALLRACSPDTWCACPRSSLVSGSCPSDSKAVFMHMLRKLMWDLAFASFPSFLQPRVIDVLASTGLASQAPLIVFLSYFISSFLWLSLSPFF